MEPILDIIKDGTLDWRQKRLKLEFAAENSISPIGLGQQAKRLFDSGVINDLGEGNAPYRPRYILPDYEKFLKNGSEFLSLSPPRDLYEAVNALMILYHYVPSVSRIPVFLGRIDALLEPFAHTVGEEERERVLEHFLVYIDRVLADAFVHMDIGPEDTIVGRLILKLEKKLKQAVPNLSFLCGETTSDELKRLAAGTALETGKPYFINDPLVRNDLGDRYGIASCYNSLPMGGGSYTLIRMNLKEAAALASDLPDFLDRVLPELTAAQCEVINARIRFIVEESHFFESSFLAREGLINRDRFTAMAGIYGLHECVEALTGGLQMGTDEAASEAAVSIVDRWAELVDRVPGLYCGGTQGKIGLHAQSLIQTDRDITAGVRIRIGNEPPLYDELRLEGKLQGVFNTGVSEICVFDKTAKDNIAGLLKIVKGAFASGIKVLALNCSDSELIRITGYLVKKSDIDKLRSGAQMREETVGLAEESMRGHRTQERRVRSVD